MIIGVGNRFRRDDGAGPVFSERMSGKGIQAVELSGEGAELMQAWEGAARVILVDAARSGAPVGTIHHFDAHEQEVPSGFFHYSSHQFAVAEAIEMARVLGRLPARLSVYGIEGRDFSYGEGLSPEVSHAIDTLETRVLEELAAGRDDR